MGAVVKRAAGLRGNDIETDDEQETGRTRSGPEGRDTGTHAGVAGNLNEEGGRMIEAGVLGPTAEQWQRVRLRLKSELGDDVFNSWFGRVEFEESDSSTVYMSVPTRFLKSWINAHYGDKLLALWVDECKSLVRTELIVRSAVRIKAASPQPEAVDAPKPAAMQDRKSVV